MLDRVCVASVSAMRIMSRFPGVSHSREGPNPFVVANPVDFTGLRDGGYVGEGVCSSVVPDRVMWFGALPETTAGGRSDQARSSHGEIDFALPSDRRAFVVPWRGQSAQKPPMHTNRLAHEKSPYLLQHAHNPVDWHPWGKRLSTKRRRQRRFFSPSAIPPATGAT